MKYLFFVLISLPAFACKMTPEMGRLRAKDAVLKAMESKTKRKDLLVKQSKTGWIVRTKKPTCVEYKLEVEPGSGDCKVTAKILSEKPCP